MPNQPVDGPRAYFASELSGIGLVALGVVVNGVVLAAILALIGLGMAIYLLRMR